MDPPTYVNLLEVLDDLVNGASTEMKKGWELDKGGIEPETIEEYTKDPSKRAEINALVDARLAATNAGRRGISGENGNTSEQLSMSLLAVLHDKATARLY